jgi:hypothetical protein
MQKQDVNNRTYANQQIRVEAQGEQEENNNNIRLLIPLLTQMFWDQEALI